MGSRFPFCDVLSSLRCSFEEKAARERQTRTHPHPVSLFFAVHCLYGSCMGSSENRCRHNHRKKRQPTVPTYAKTAVSRNPSEFVGTPPRVNTSPIQRCLPTSRRNWDLVWLSPLRLAGRFLQNSSGRLAAMPLPESHMLRRRPRC